MSEDSPPLEPQLPPDEDLPEVRRRLWDLEWRLRRESGALAEKLAGIFKEIVQASNWGSEAIADGFTPLLVDFKRRLTALETRAVEGTAQADPAFQALSERVEVLERLVEDGVAAQRSELARVDERLEGLDGRLAAVEAWSESLDALRVQAEQSRVVADRLVEALGRISELAERTAGLETVTEQLHGALAQTDQGLREHAAELVGAVRAELEEPVARGSQALELASSCGGRLDDHDEALRLLESTISDAAGDLGIRVGGVEETLSRHDREIAEKVPLAQFATNSLTMAAQQAAIKDLKAQLAALGAPPPEHAALGEAAKAAPQDDRLGPVWDALARLEARIGDLGPHFERLSREIEESNKGTKGLLANWMEMENRIHFLAEKRQVEQLEARISALVDPSR